jgi:Ca2+-binding EF-hand superfamily protein
VRYLKTVFHFYSSIQLMLVFSLLLLQSLSKALTEDELVYLRAQFRLLEPNRDGRVSLENFKMVIYSSIL